MGNLVTATERNAGPKAAGRKLPSSSGSVSVSSGVTGGLIPTAPDYFLDLRPASGTRRSSGFLLKLNTLDTVMPWLNLHCACKPDFTGQAWNFMGQDPNTVDWKTSTYFTLVYKH